jgi:hypothetical protein
MLEAMRDSLRSPERPAIPAFELQNTRDWQRVLREAGE